MKFSDHSNPQSFPASINIVMTIRKQNVLSLRVILGGKVGGTRSLQVTRPICIRDFLQRLRITRLPVEM